MKEVKSKYDLQAEKFLKKHDIFINCAFKDRAINKDWDNYSRNSHTITFIKAPRKSFQITFWDSINNTKKGITSVKPYDVLTCLTKSDPGTFEEFCGEFGYDTDSRSDEKIWKAIKKEWKQVSGFFTKAEIEELQEIQL